MNVIALTILYLNFLFVNVIYKPVNYIQCGSWEEERVLQGHIRVEEQWREDVPSAPQLLDLM